MRSHGNIRKNGEREKHAMLKSNVLAAAAMVALAGCQQAGGKVDTAAIENQLKQAEARWNRAYAAHDGAALAGMYADDAVLANPGAPPVSGIDGIRKETAAFAADPKLQVKFASDRIRVAASGDLAYTRGHYTMTMTDPATNKPAHSRGSYLTVWQKQPDGEWKAIEDFVTPGPGPA
ncbi:MAG: SgcJ/EcaC family oxidoreductase [Novosphingobium sp.]|nr:SgcJ/EcaC family oxidoreductase [Novosphingobium sp.]